MASGAPGNVKQAWQFLLGKGLSPAQAAGVIGSMQGESGKGLDPAAVNPGPDHATGIAQWLGGRKTAAVLTKQLGPQLNHLWSELQGPESAALRALKGTHTPEAAAVAWQKVFERGAPFEQKYNMRAANAREVFNSLKGTAGSSVLPSSPEQALMGGSGGGSQDSSSGLNAGVAALLAAGQQKPQIQSAGIAAPAFSARPALPQGAQLPQGGGGPVSRGPDVSGLLALVAGQGGQGAAPVAGGAGSSTPSGGAGGYVDPFGSSLKAPGRIDEGVDATIQGPIRAVGNAKVVALHRNFYKGLPYLVYQLTDGPHAGKRVFVAENIQTHVKPGDRVSAGDVVATGAGGIETGWAGGPSGNWLPLANKAQGGNYTEGLATDYGKSFAQFLKRLGSNAAR